MITNKNDFEELSDAELINISGGVTIWRYVGIYVGLRLEGFDHTNALIATSGLAYLEN